MPPDSAHQYSSFRSLKSPICALSAPICLLFACSALAGTLDIRVVDPDGQPVPEVAVFLKQETPSGIDSATAKTAVMDQRDIRFVPHVLVVQTGTKVEFPNSDTVAHHVYSFSKPNGFVLPLYKGASPDPVVFDIDGVVTLGCNIHDNMLGYIVVVNSDVFAVTDQDGRASLDIDDAESQVEVSIWSARIRDSQDPITQAVSGDQSKQLTFSLQKKLRPRHEDNTDSIEWADY